jgi:hypothetical protein
MAIGTKMVRVALFFTITWAFAGNAQSSDEPEAGSPAPARPRDVAEPARSSEPTTNTGVQKKSKEDLRSFRMVFSAVASPFVAYGNKTLQAYIGVAVSPEFRLRFDMTRFLSVGAAVQYNGFSAITAASDPSRVAPVAAGRIEATPVTAVVGLSIDVGKLSALKSQTISVGFSDITIGLGWSNYRIGEDLYDSGFIFQIGFSLAALSFNFKYVDSET